MLAADPTFDYRLGFRSLDAETSVAALPVRGALPPWLEGTLLRNGPGRFEVGGERYRHWFDGLGMLHRFTIAAGNVSYANRFLRSPAFLESERTGHIAFPEFDTDPKTSLIRKLGKRLRGRGGTSDNANVNIVPFGDEFLALTETPSPVAFDGASLATRAVLAYDDDVPGQMTTAHTHYDAARRATFNIVTEIGRTSRYQIVRIPDGTLRRETIGSIVVDKPGYIHAFSTTERYAIVFEYPLVVQPLDLLFRRKPFIENYRWEPDRATRIHVVAKDGGALVGRFEAPAFFAFHHVNAFEEGETIVVDVSAYDDAGIIADFTLDRVLANDGTPPARSSLRRFRLTPGRTNAEVETLAHESTELPSIAPRNAGKPYAFAYGVDSASAAPFDAIVKVDVRTRAVTRWSSPGAFPGEPVFVPRPGAADEDDGAILTVVLDAPTSTSHLVILDARTLEERARAVAPHHIPFGFHGIFR